MGLVLVVLAVALTLSGGRSLVRGGRPSPLRGLRLRGSGLLVTAVVAQAAGAVLGGPAAAAGLGLSALLAVAFLGRNRGLRGTGLVALGLLANALVVSLNGAMPVSPQAALRAGAPLPPAGDPRHEPEDPRTRLRVLGDVVPVPLPLRPEVVSPGDVAVAAGLGQLVLAGLAGAGASAPRRGAPARSCATLTGTPTGGGPMAKKGRKKRARKKSKANHGNRPNA